MVRKAGRTNVDWQTLESPNYTWDQVNTEVLMDIRDELRKMNALLHCQNFIAIPRVLSEIRAATRMTNKLLKEPKK